MRKTCMYVSLIALAVFGLPAVASAATITGVKAEQ
jgi:hypothetical protein